MNTPTPPHEDEDPNAAVFRQLRGVREHAGIGYAPGDTPPHEEVDPEKVVEELQHAGVCQRFLNGSCQLRSCSVRGGYAGGKPDYELSRCIYFDAASTITALVHERAVLVAALRSIAANTCCDTCREAALVARHALAAFRHQENDHG